MEINYSFEKKEFYLQLTLTGKFNLNEILSFGRIVKENVKKKIFTRFLLIL
jgi:hypothetical protein